jgi:hypothetical protein
MRHLEGTKGLTGKLHYRQAASWHTEQECSVAGVA